MWNNAGARVTFEWKAGSIFAIPLNCWYQHFNGSGQEVVRFVAVTNCPSVLNLYDDLDFVFNYPLRFQQALLRRARLLHRQGRAGRLPAAAPISSPTPINLPLITAKERGAGGGHIRFNMAQGLDREPHLPVPGRHLQEGACARAGRARHRALGRGLFADVAGGRGAARYEWKFGTLIVPPNAWFHQHFNSGPTPARYLAFKHSSPRNSQGVPMSWISRRLGGTQIDYADEKPLVRQLFAEALAKHGLTPRMDEVYDGRACRTCRRKVAAA